MVRQMESLGTALLDIDKSSASCWKHETNRL